jgi:bifunctional non-homologous end joining protein LigD
MLGGDQAVPHTHLSQGDALDRYRQKRNFTATPEPKGKRARKTSALRFVIQKHAASHLHYDFRLELEGTLKSWAVPKGPSLDPHDKRLAMHVEDHPLDYADFEGVIPPGNYGAGTVIVWDNGEWEPIGDPQEGYNKGRLKFQLLGKKLHGAWNLVRSHDRDGKNKNVWFLIKSDDEAARAASKYSVVDAEPDSVLGGESGAVWQSNRSTSQKKSSVEKSKKSTSDKTLKPSKFDLPKKAKSAALPLTLAPQLAVLVDHIPASANWMYEVKYDGYRLLTRIDGDSIRLFTRNGNDWTAKLKHLLPALAKLPLHNGWLDGEIVMVDEQGQSSFQTLQNAFESSRTAKIIYYIFDVPFASGHDLRNVPLAERRVLLESLLQKSIGPIALSQSFEVPAKQLFAHACEMHLEGLIGKRIDSLYQSSRSRDWIKLKCLQRQEFVIGGYTDPAGSRTGTFGSLLLGVHDPKTGKLRYAGRVGTGFTDETLRTLMKKLKPLVRKDMPFEEFTGEKPSRNMHWVEPKLIGEVAFSEWTAGGHLRHPSFQGLRNDKASSSVTEEKPISINEVDASTPARSKKRPTKIIEKDKKIDELNIGGIHVTHANRIVDASSTKGDIVRYYDEIAALILPHLADRPVSLVRAPAGIDGQHFFQKHLNSVKIPHLRELDPDLFPEHPPLLAIDSKEALLACAQMNVIELHTWNATSELIDKPDRMIFDIDPGEGIVWKQIQQAAELTKALLDEIGLRSFLKTSGGKGLHVIVPIIPEFDWDTVKDFSKAVVQHLAITLPTLFVAKSGPKNRVKRIFVDYLRNGLGATTASAFSVRARPGLGVSVPISWSDLDKITSAAQWTIRDVETIAAIGKKNPWKSLKQTKQSLKSAATALGIELKTSKRKSNS